MLYLKCVCVFVDGIALRCRFYTYAHWFSTVISIGFPIFGAYVQFTTSSPITLLRSKQNTITWRQVVIFIITTYWESTKKHKKNETVQCSPGTDQSQLQGDHQKEKRNVLHLSDVRRNVLRSEKLYRDYQYTNTVLKKKKREKRRAAPKTDFRRVRKTSTYTVATSFKLSTVWERVHIDFEATSLS